jgi:hypothetical protein
MVALELLAAENRTPRLAGEPVHRQGVGRLLGHPAGACRNGAGVRIPPVAPWLALPAERRAAAGPAGRTLRLLDGSGVCLFGAVVAGAIGCESSQRASVARSTGSSTPRRRETHRGLASHRCAPTRLATRSSQPRTRCCDRQTLTSDIYLRITGGSRQPRATSHDWRVQQFRFTRPSARTVPSTTRPRPEALLLDSHHSVVG